MFVLIDCTLKIVKQQKLILVRRFYRHVLWLSYDLCVETLFVSDYANAALKNADRATLGSLEIKEVKHIFAFLTVYGIPSSLNIEKFCYFKLQ